MADRPSAPRYYLGLRRPWWVVVCVLLLCAVDALPFVGPYAALAVLLWMVSGLARATERPETAAVEPVRAGRARSAESVSALPSS
ncbi:MAG: hypothetical protein ACTHJL_11815 [Amnibacterium sp.]